jgi:imidazolonepropionase-like amidohydrolase
MNTRKSLLLLQAVAVLAAAMTLGPLSASEPSRALPYAIRGAMVHTAAGAPIANGTVLIRDGVIEAVGASVNVPSDAIVIDGAGMHVYPGLIDMANDAPIDTGEAPQQAQGGRGGGGGGRGGGGGQQFENREEAERAKRAQLLRPDFLAADNLRTESEDLTALANAGVTTVLAVPGSGIFKGQSALVNVALPPDDPQISNVGEYRKGVAVITAPVAMHIDMAGRGGGPGYPQALLGTIAFTKQGFLDAQWQMQARAHANRGGQRPVLEPSLDALAPVLARQLPAAFDAGEAREIDRALAMAKEFNLDPIIVGASGAADRTAELAAAKARVILSLNFPSAEGGGRGGGRGGRGGGGGGTPSLRQLQTALNAPKTPAALAAANVPFVFTSGGASPADFVANARRVVRDGGVPAEVVLAALTIDAARMAGAEARTGSIEAGKAANVIVTNGDLFDNGQVRHVFIDGVMIEVEPPAAPAGGGRRGGGGR